MSATITLSTGQTEVIHGTLAAARLYIGMMYGPTYDAWTALLGSGPTADDAQKKTLAAAVRLLNEQAWSEDYDTFAERDAVEAFENAEYELAVAIAANPSLVLAANTGSNIQSISSAGTAVTYFNSTTKDATPLPPILMRLIGSYLASASASPVEGSEGQTGACKNPLSDCVDFDRKAPY